ncbi:nuclear pore membrane glycoprotein 210 [Nephila pilipes]|uniref:Nuclear pore membrane glycoprotein 210 n=1 Tax=Nephila pilipes TaxID=299642 RepID=A0A8X6QFH8_NEPPI|nr:nuclear pore membrane glycoprotein 210 [Nephila pilipes]
MSGIELNCVVITDFPDKIELSSTTDELPIESSPEVLTVIAKDKSGHLFTSVNGLKFEWKLEEEQLDESVESPGNIVASLRPFSSSHEYFKVDGWALRGLLGHSVLVEALNVGSCKIRASLRQTETRKISTQEVKLRVTPNVKISPCNSIRILRYGTVELGVEHIQGRKLEYKKDFNINIGKPEIAQLDGDSSKLVALEYGQTHLTLTSNRESTSFPDFFLKTDIKVVKPARLEIRISRGGFTMLEELKSYTLTVDIFDDEGNAIFPSDNIKLSVTFPAQLFYVNSTSSNGTFHVVQALAPGKNTIKAELKGVVLSDGSLHKYSLQNTLTVTVCQKIQISPPFTLLPSDTLSSSPHEIRLMATGGTGNYRWTSNSSSAIIHFDKEKSHMALIQIKNEGDFTIILTDEENINFLASAKISVAPVIDIETYPTVVEAQVSNILILPVAFLAEEDRDRKIIRKFDDCSKIEPKVEIIEKHVLTYDKEPHIPAFGKGCRSLQFRCKYPGHSRINVYYESPSEKGENSSVEIHKTTTVLSCFKDLKPVHPVRVAVLPLGSSMEIAFDGGPRKWPLMKENHYTILEASKPELIDIELIRDPIRYNKDLTVFRVLCKALGENVLTFRIGNEPSATNKHPAKSEVSIKFVCSKPHSLHLKLFRKSEKKKLKDENIVKVPFYGSKQFSVDVWLKDSKGRKLYNISSLSLRWKVSDFSLAIAEETENGFTTHDNAVAGYRKISREFKEFKMPGGSGKLEVKAALLGYRNDVLKKAGVSDADDSLDTISGSIDLKLVSLRDINAEMYSTQDDEKQEEDTCDGDSCKGH